MHTKSISELSLLLDDGELSSVELTRYFLDRIGKARELNAFITVNPEGALARAELADSARASGESAALLGIPIAHKDIFCTDGVLTSCGSRMLSNFVAPYDATVVERMNEAGTVVLGKTNMDEFAMGSSSETSWYGPVSNPWDTSRVPGGSSGGSAAAVAAGLVPAATGTDTGGSIRQPAAFCGITGLKPSYGRCSRYGMVAFASSLDQAGPMTRSAKDAALLLGCMAGFDPRDSTSMNVDTPDYMSDLEHSLQGLRIGFPREYSEAGLASEIESCIQQALDTYSGLGAEIIEVTLPNSTLAVPCYYVLAPAEASSNLSRFDGVRYGHRAEDYTDLVEMYTRTRTEGFGDEVKRRIMIGTYALSSGYYDAYYAKAQKLRRLISNDFETAFETCDIILGPSTPTPAFAKGDKSDDPVEMYLNDLFTIPANLAGLPAISIPAGFSGAGLPIGLHLVAPFLGESQLLNVAHQFQVETDWHRRVPPTSARETQD